MRGIPSIRQKRHRQLTTPTHRTISMVYLFPFAVVVIRIIIQQWSVDGKRPQATSNAANFLLPPPSIHTVFTYICLPKKMIIQSEVKTEKMAHHKPLCMSYVLQFIDGCSLNKCTVNMDDQNGENLRLRSNQMCTMNSIKNPSEN